ncbi:SDR family NAD(P)-dependent oxidoreductase [Salimicrobium album]|uniref:3-oxoacyl-[acyl-carrier protein] reductase n=1 Tax=Salimicrobium album TaxID=50717 RepID=A0A1H3H6Y5_9BACI|nr:SDR family NAD(P)-dependent oxidoreductase [Salimicrobium album]SDY11323.1 3-oxoacyl-[acyl-carrier protein] reductase [Salimicrobium album]
MGRLDNKTAIVIGGTSGLGEATSKKFAEEGARVAVVGLEEEKGEAIVKEIRKAKGEAVFVQMDVTDRESVQNGINKTVEQFGTVDVLYNGAGVHDAYKNVVETDEDTFDKLMNVNVKGPYLAANAAVPIFLEKGKGTIINIGSQSTFVAGAGGNTYVTSKHAIHGFTKQLAYDFGSKGIKANLIAPGFIDTPMTKGIDDERLKDIPAGRAGKPEEIAAAAVFLASDESDYMQGAELKVDGGWTVGR